MRRKAPATANIPMKRLILLVLILESQSTAELS